MRTLLQIDLRFPLAIYLLLLQDSGNFAMTEVSFRDIK